MSVEPYTDTELLALGSPPTKEEQQKQLADLRTQALELEAKGALACRSLRPQRDCGAVLMRKPEPWVIAIVLKRLGFNINNGGN